MVECIEGDCGGDLSLPWRDGIVIKVLSITKGHVDAWVDERDNIRWKLT